VPLFLAGLYVLNFADAGLNPVMPLYLAALGAPPDSLATVAGAVVAAASVGAALSAYALGRIGGRFGVRPVLVVVLVAGAALSLLMAQAPTWWLLGASRVALGLVVGGGPALAYAAAAVAVPDARRALAMGFMTTGGLLGLASGPVAAGLTERVGSETIFVVNAGLYGLAAAGLLAAAASTESTWGWVISGGVCPGMSGLSGPPPGTPGRSARTRRSAPVRPSHGLHRTGR
jgi:MFS family permease